MKPKSKMMCGLMLMGVFLFVGCTDGGGSSTPPKVPSMDDSDYSEAGSGDCVAVMESTTEQKIALQEELAQAMAEDDMETLERLDEEMTSLSQEVIDACGE